MLPVSILLRSVSHVKGTTTPFATRGGNSILRGTTDPNSVPELHPWLKKETVRAQSDPPFRHIVGLTQIPNLRSHASGEATCSGSKSCAQRSGVQ